MFKLGTKYFDLLMYLFLHISKSCEAIWGELFFSKSKVHMNCNIYFAERDFKCKYFLK